MHVVLPRAAVLLDPSPMSALTGCGSQPLTRDLAQRRAECSRRLYALVARPADRLEV
jgi:hypothetical protein